MRQVLLSAAMMPSAGAYHIWPISVERFTQAIREANDLESYIGYPTTQVVLETLCGFPVPSQGRKMVVLSEPTRFLVMKLGYRIQNPTEKAMNTHGTKVEDFEFYEGQFEPFE